MSHIRRTRKSSPAMMTNMSTMAIYSELVNRANLGARLGTMSYDGARDVYQALGYPKTLSFIDNYYPQYVRHELAKAVIDRPVRAAWRGGMTIQEKGKKGEISEIQKAWEKIYQEFKLHTMFMRVDKLTGLGRYGVFFLGLNDNATNEQLVNPVSGKSNKLLFIKPLSEESAKIKKFETNISDPRFGLPLIYEITMKEEDGTSSTISVHYTRIVHITDDLLESEVFGTPRLESVFNRLLDIEKIVGGDAEIYWRGARPGFGGKVEKDFTLTPEGEAGVMDQFSEYENNFRRFLLLEGIEVKEFKQQIGDPTKNVDVQISMISAEKGIPKRVLMGSERGELSSSQDKEEWNLWVQSRREEFMEPKIVRPLVDTFMKLGILPMTENYIIHWDELFAMSPTEKASIAEKIANAIRYYTATPTAEYILPKKIFLRKILGLTEEEIEEIEKLVDELPDIESIINPQEQAAIGSDVGGKDPNAGTGKDTVAKKQKATV